MKIIICGGHLTPAAATIEELRIKNKELRILFIGRKHPLEGESTVSAEYKIIPQMGIPFVSLAAGRLQRKFTRYTIPSLLKIPVGFIQALWWVGKFRPDVILSFGGYIALPVVVSGWLLRVPVITHEQTVVSGLANKIISYFAQKICVSWPDSVGHFPSQKVVLTGNPIRKEIFEINENSQFAPPAGGRNLQLPIIYITGGSLGSHWINEAVSECLPQLLEKYTVIHQCGDSERYADLEKLKVKSEKFKVELRKRYFLIKYVEPEDIGWVLNRANLVVSRSGANTVSELAALGKPAIFIPLPWAQSQEQLKNAALLESFGGAKILPQENLSGVTLQKLINEMMENIESLRLKAQGAKKITDLNAADKIIRVVNDAYKQKRKR